MTCCCAHYTIRKAYYTYGHDNIIDNTILYIILIFICALHTRTSYGTGPITL